MSKSIFIIIVVAIVILAFVLAFFKTEPTSPTYVPGQAFTLPLDPLGRCIIKVKGKEITGCKKKGRCPAGCEFILETKTCTLCEEKAE